MKARRVALLHAAVDSQAPVWSQLRGLGAFRVRYGYWRLTVLRRHEVWVGLITGLVLFLFSDAPSEAQWTGCGGHVWGCSGSGHPSDRGSSSSGYDYSSDYSGRTDSTYSPASQAYRLHVLGISLFEQGRYEEAYDYFSRALELAPGDPTHINNVGAALSGLGMRSYRQGRYEEALNYFHRAEAAYRNAIKGRAKGAAEGLAEAVNNKGNALMALKRWGEAEAAYREAIQRGAKYALANLAILFENKGHALQNQQRYDEAITAYRDAIRINSTDASTQEGLARTFNAKGSALYNQQRHAEAITAFQEASRINPNVREYSSNLILAFISSKRYNDAFAETQQAFRRFPNDPTIRGRYLQLLDLHGNDLWQQGKPEEARQAYQKALALDSGQTPVSWWSRSGAQQKVAALDEVIKNRTLTAAAVAEFDRVRGRGTEESAGAAMLNERIITRTVDGRPETFVTWLQPSTRYTTAQEQLIAASDASRLAATAGRLDSAGARATLNFDTTGLPALTIVQINVPGPGPSIAVGTSPSQPGTIPEQFRRDPLIVALVERQSINSQKLANITAELQKVSQQPSSSQKDVIIAGLNDQQMREEQKRQFLNLAVQERLV